MASLFFKVYVADFVQFCIFVSQFEKTHSAITVRITKNTILSCFNFYEGSK